MRYIFILLFVGLFNNLAFSSIAVTNGLIQIYNVQPGGSYNGVIELQNTASNNQGIQVSLNDFLTRANGESLFLKPGSNERSLTQWISLSQNMINIKGKEKFTFTYEIHIPELPSLTGSYWCVILLEPVQDLDSASLKKNTVNIQTLVRYAIQVVCHIGDTGKKAVKYLNVEVTKVEGKRMVNVDIENAGEKYMRPVVELQFFDTEGNEAGIFHSVDQGLFPFSSNRFMIDISTLKPGQYKLVLLSDCGGDDVFGSNLSLTVKDD